MNLNKIVKYKSVRIAIVNLRLYYIWYIGGRNWLPLWLNGRVLALGLGGLRFESHGCTFYFYPRRARSAIGVDTVFTLDDGCMFVCLYVSALERKRLIGMT